MPRPASSFSNSGEEAFATLTKFANETALTAASLTAIGAFEKASVGWFDFEKKTYKKIEVAEQCEVLSAIGDLAIGDDGKASLHVHVVLGLSDGTTRGGHLLAGTVRPTLEVVLTDTPAHLRRKKRPGYRHRPDQSRRDQEALISVASSGEGGYSCVPRTIAGWGEGLIRFTGGKPTLVQANFPTIEVERRRFGVSPTKAWPRSPVGPPRRPVLAQEGRRCLVDPERRDRHVGRSRAGRPPRVRRRTRPAASIGPLQALGEVRQRGGKRVIAFCGEADFDTTSLVSNSFEIEWPPSSGRIAAFPEVDRAAWFDLNTVRSKILSGRASYSINSKRSCHKGNHGSPCIGSRPAAVAMPHPSVIRRVRPEATRRLLSGLSL